ncbi:MAG TPA: hypothetical protein VJS67_10340 [Pseudonocardiaceae bacterium]|nr:hypothetical protein [Pseudonocardiaceae bacterium]
MAAGRGADKVAQFAIGIARGEVPEMGLRFLDVGGDPVVLVTSVGKPYAFVSLAVVDACVTRAYWWQSGQPHRVAMLRAGSAGWQSSGNDRA